MNNLDLYNKWRAVPKEACKEFSNGSFSGTDINPMWRIKMLTEVFGPCGIGWYYEVLSERSEQHEDSTMAIVDLNLYIKVNGEWSKPIYGTGGNLLVRTTKNGPKASDEGYKMALTDALSVACKALGIGADIYFANDRTKYTAQETKPVSVQQKAEQPATVTAMDPAQVAAQAKKAECIKILIRNAVEAYGDDSTAKLNQYLKDFGITFDTMTGPLFKQINKMIERDIKGAA